MLWHDLIELCAILRQDPVLDDSDRSKIDLLVELAPGTELGPWLERLFEFQGGTHISFYGAGACVAQTTRS